MSDVKGFRNVLTDIKTVIGLITVIVLLIGWTLKQSNEIGDAHQKMTHMEAIYGEKFKNIEKLLESIDKAIGWNRNYIVNQRPSKVTTAYGTSQD